MKKTSNRIKKCILLGYNSNYLQLTAQKSVKTWEKHLYYIKNFKLSGYNLIYLPLIAQKLAEKGRNKGLT